MKNFTQWLQEDGTRTSLGIYPASYGAGQYPPAYFSPTSSTAFLNLASNYQINSDNSITDKPKKKKKKKKKNKG